MTFFQFLKKQKREAPRRFFILLFAVSFAFWGGIIVLASPPDTPYAPGYTLDPDCLPGSANCTVYPPLATGLTATTTVTMSDYPLNFDSGTFYIDSLNNRIGIGTTSPATALDMASGVITLGNNANPLIQQYDNAAWGTLTKKLTIQGGATSASDVITFDAKGILEGLSYQDTILAEPSLTSYWQMDNNWTDSKGANDGTATGATFGTAKYGSASGSFDGNDYVTMGTNILNYTSNISVEAWIKETGDNTNGASIVDNSGGGWSNGYALAFTDPNTIIFFINFGWGGNEATFTLVNDGEWHHVVGTYDGTTVRIYVDGVEGTPYSYSEPIEPCTTAFRLGYGGGGYFTGLIDEAAVYNTALSAGTILEHFNATGEGPFRTKVKIKNSGTTDVDLYLDGDIYGGAGNTKLKLTPSVANGASALAYVFDTENTLSTAGAKLLSVKNNGTEKVYINKDGGAYFAGNVGIGTSTPYAKLSVWGGGTGTGQAFEIANSASTTLASILDNGTAYFAGNVGIGTTTPNNTIQVKDLINFDNAKSGTFLGHLAGNSNTGGLNTFVGYQAGKSNTAGFENTAIGWQALMTNTSAGENTAVGANALASNVSGVDNTAVGVLTLQDNISGDENTAVGIQSLQTNTTGYNNTSMGAYSLYHNTTGYDNIAIGINAGRFIADGVSHNHTSNTSVYLGAATKALTDSDTNEIVIGYNAIGLGSNSAILGNDSITKTVLNGNVGIGTTTPYAKLSVWGGGTGTGQAFEIANSASSTLASILDNGTAYFAGNVGIGTSTPNNTIQVKDLINFDNSVYGTFLGYQAGNVNTGGDNSFVGYQSGLNNTTGASNTAIGYRSLYSNISGVANTVVGERALYLNNSGYYNVAVGINTLHNNISGYSNTVVGTDALSYNISGRGNTGIGLDALYSNLSGNDNLALGNFSLFTNTIGSSNTAVGFSAGYLITGSNNILLGYQAGDALTTGSNNIILGYDIDAPLDDGSNQLSIGNLIFGTGINGTNKTISTGNVGIGTTTPYAKLSVWGGGTGTGQAFEIANSASTTLFTVLDNGNIGIGTSTPWRKLSVAGTAGFSGLTNDSTGYYLCLNTTTYEMATSTTACGASSLRFKENVQPMTYGLSEILQLNPVFYDWKDTYLPSENKRQIGLIAEEVSSIIPELAGYDSQGEPINVDYPKATAVIIKAIQELNEKISSLPSTAVSQLASSFDGILDWLGDKVVRAKEFVAEKVSAKKVATDALEMKDNITGEIYCVRISNGEWEKFKGTCGEVAESSQPPVVSSQTESLEQPITEPEPPLEPVVAEPVVEEPPLESAEADPTGQAVVEETAAAQ